MSRGCTALIMTLALCLCINATTQSKQAVDPCVSCHADLTKVLPIKHVEVAKGGLEQCTACHKSSGEAEKNAFSTRLHLAHEGDKQKLECTDCHRYAAGKSFGLIGQDVSWGTPKDDDLTLMKQKMATWSSSGFTDHAHSKAGVDCAGCHGKDAPLSDSTVESDRCLKCHGPIEQLAAKSANIDFPKRNPHASHYGNDIACTTCHHAHEGSVVMCAGCHKLWTLTIPGAVN
jgi:hypothetical protein